MSEVVTRSTSDLLDELREEVADQPWWRLHVRSSSAMWIAISVENMGLSGHVRVVADPACRDAGRGWVEVVTAERWRALRGLVGQRVVVATAELGRLTGVLVELERGEARLDLGGGDLRYLPWLTVEPEGVG